MKRIHYISGLTITIFVVLHLCNHAVSLVGVESHIAFMDKLRLVYRNPIVETLLLGVVLVQIISGLKLAIMQKGLAVGFYKKIQIWSGLYIAMFLLIHVGAVLMGRYILQLDTNFYFGAIGLNTFPFNLFFIPYYGLAIVAFFGHVSAIHFHKMRSTILGVSVEQQSRIIFLIGVVVAIVILYGMTNGFNGVEIPEEYNIMIGG